MLQNNSNAISQQAPIPVEGQNVVLDIDPTNATVPLIESNLIRNDHNEVIKEHVRRSSLSQFVSSSRASAMSRISRPTQQNQTIRPNNVNESVVEQTADDPITMQTKEAMRN